VALVAPGRAIQAEAVEVVLRGVEAPHADDHLEADVGDGYEGEDDAVRLVGDLVGDEGGKDGQGDPRGIPEGDDVVEMVTQAEEGHGTVEWWSRIEFTGGEKLVGVVSDVCSPRW
jgi:hypothetical protein